MQTRHLIDRIVQQTTVLIAQLSTAAGLRAPLSRVADQVFYELAREIEAQGVGRKVAADMFGLALRTYQKKVQRLSESVSVRDRTLWEAIFELLQAEGSLSRAQLHARFKRDPEQDVAAVLHDLVDSGLLYTTGRGQSAVYGLTDQADRVRVERHHQQQGLAYLVWLAVYDKGSMDFEQLCLQLGVAADDLAPVVEGLVSEGHITRDADQSPPCLSARRLSIPVGTSAGWEAAVLDHFQAMATAIAAKLQGGSTRSKSNDIVGGGTLRFEVHANHPYAERVYGCLERVRTELGQLWDEVCAYNRQHPVPEDERSRVCFYFGQSVQDMHEGGAGSRGSRHESDSGPG